VQNESGFVMDTLYIGVVLFTKIIEGVYKKRECEEEELGHRTLSCTKRFEK
jgi:hypothetical protein